MVIKLLYLINAIVSNFFIVNLMVYHEKPKLAEGTSTFTILAYALLTISLATCAYIFYLSADIIRYLFKLRGWNIPENKDRFKQRLRQDAKRLFALFASSVWMWLRLV